MAVSRPWRSTVLSLGAWKALSPPSLAVRGSTCHRSYTTRFPVCATGRAIDRPVSTLPEGLQLPLHTRLSCDFQACGFVCGTLRFIPVTYAMTMTVTSATAACDSSPAPAHNQLSGVIHILTALHWPRNIF